MEWLTKEQMREKFLKEHPNYEWKSKKIIKIKNKKYLKKQIQKKKYPKGHWPLGGIDRLREDIRIRDKYTCQECGKKWKKGERRFDTHNKNFNDDYTYKQSKIMDEWTTVCHSCNGKLHRNYRNKILKGRKN